MIDTGRKAAPKPAPQPKVSAAKAPAAADTSAPVAPTVPAMKDAAAAKPTAKAASPAGSKMPLLLIIGGIGGALVLAIAASAVTAYLFMDRERPPEVAVATEQNPDDATPPASTENAADPADDSATPGDGAADDNPDDKPVDEPDMPTPGDGEDNGGEEGGGENITPDNPADGGEPAVQNPPPDGGEPAPPPEPPKEGPLKEEPPKEDPPKPKPPKDPPKPKNINPFETVDAAVALPALPGGKEPAAGILSPLKIPDDTAIYIDLLGGDKVSPDEKDRFTLDRARQGLADREWEVKLEGPAAGPAVIANMELTGDGLSFKWTEEAAKLEAAPYLCNCLLNLRTADHETFVSLRKPQEATALAYRLDKPVLREKYTIANPPRADSIFVEFTGVGEYEKYAVLPKEKLTVDRDSTQVQFGEGAGSDGRRQD